MQLSCADTLLGFVPVPPCAAEPMGQDQTEHGAGCGSISNSVLKIGNSLVIFTSGKADKEIWCSICKCRKCPHHLLHSCISASLTLFRTDRAGYGFPFPNSECDGLGRVVKATDQNVIY